MHILNYCRRTKSTSAEVRSLCVPLATVPASLEVCELRCVRFDLPWSFYARARACPRFDPHFVQCVCCAICFADVPSVVVFVAGKFEYETKTLCPPHCPLFAQRFSRSEAAISGRSSAMPRTHGYFLRENKLTKMAYDSKSQHECPCWGSVMHTVSSIFTFRYIGTLWPCHTRRRY